MGEIRHIHREPERAASAMKILFVDPEQMVRFALTNEIHSMSPFHVVGYANDAEEALKQIKVGRPEILLTEMQLPGKSGLELLHDLRREKIEIISVICSAFASTQSIQRAFSYGAYGYVSKLSPVAELLHALEQVSEKRRFLSPRLQSLTHWAEVPNVATHTDPLSPLSPREREIFFHLANGLQNSAIARQLFISPRTVETHRARIVRKLGVRTNSELIRYAIKNEVSFL